MRKIILVSFIFLLINVQAYAGKQEKNALEGNGYVGKLPDLTRQYHSEEQKETKPVFEQTKDFHSANEIKPVPRDNPAFLNIILKTDKTSMYTNDINEIIPMYERVLQSIEDEENVQKFVSKVYFLNKNVEYLTDKYQGKPESKYASFQQMTKSSLHCKSVALLRSEAEKYSPYLAYQGAGYIYNKNNINDQLEYLKAEIEQTIAILKDVN